MMKYKKLIILLAFSQQICLHVAAQEVKINERIPDVLLPELVRYGKSKINLRSEFEGKPLIIDFWFTYCASCIAAMPKLDSLYKKHDGKFNVLMSTFEEKKIIEKFLTNKNVLRNTGLPTTTSDTILLKIFPHIYSPHEIWIDKHGIVQAITGADAINEANITKFINGESLNLPVKEEPIVSFSDVSKSFLEVDRLPTYQYSYIGGYQKKMENQFRGYTENGIFGLKVVNFPLKKIYQLAYALKGLKKCQYSYENVDTTIFESYDDSGKNLFCYDLMLRDTVWDHLRQYMQKDLDRFFKITSTVQSKLALCYVVSKTDEHSNPDTTDIVDGFTDYYKEDGAYVFKHATWQAVMVYLNREIIDPIVDETGNRLAKKIALLSVPLDWSNLEKVNKEIKEYNLRITREFRKIDFLVFTKGNVATNDITRY